MKRRCLSRTCIGINSQVISGAKQFYSVLLFLGRTKHISRSRITSCGTRYSLEGEFTNKAIIFKKYLERSCGNPSVALLELCRGSPLRTLLKFSASLFESRYGFTGLFATGGKNQKGLGSPSRKSSLVRLQPRLSINWRWRCSIRSSRIVAH